MDRPMCGNDIDDRDKSASASAGSQAPHQGWACPLFKSDPIHHYACMAFKLGRVSDVRQHLVRKHPEEAKRMKTKKGKKKTNEGRWYALWDDLFPNQTRPPNPYTGIEVVELLSAFVTEYSEQRREEVASADGQTALMGCLAYVKTRALDGKPGDLSDQGVTDVSEHHTRGTGVQDGTHQLPTIPLAPTMTSLEQPAPYPFFAGYCDAPAFGTTIEPPALLLIGKVVMYCSV